MTPEERSMITLGHLHGVPVRAGAGLRAKHLGSVIILEAEERRGRGDGILLPPFWVSKAGVDEEDDSKLLARVRPGLVNNLEPTTVGGEDDWIFGFTADGTKWLYLEVALDGSGTVSAPSLNVASAVPAQPAGEPSTGAPPATSYRAVAKVVKADGALTITNYLRGSQWVTVGVSDFGCTFLERNVNWFEGAAP